MYSLQYNPNLYYMKTTLQQIFGAFTFLHHSVTLLFPLRHIKQTHLPLYHLLFHPPREHILRRLPLRLPSTSMNHIQHLPKRPDIRPLEGRKQTKLRPSVLTRHRTAQAANSIKSRLIKRINLQPFAADIFPYIPVQPVHNGIADPFSLKFTVFKQSALLIIIVIQDNLLTRIRHKVLKHPTVVLPLHTFRPANPRGDKPIPAGILFEDLMERNRENSCFYRTFPLFSFHNTFITSVQDLSAKTKGHRFFAMMLFHLLKFLCLLFQKLPVSFLHRLWHKPLLW